MTQKEKEEFLLLLSIYASLSLSITLSFHNTFITEYKSGVLVAQQSCTLKNIAKSQTLPIYPPSLNSPLVEANPSDLPISLS